MSEPEYSGKTYVFGGRSDDDKPNLREVINDPDVMIDALSNMKHGNSIQQTLDFAGCYVSNNPVAVPDVPTLLEAIFATIEGFAVLPKVAEPERPKATKKQISDSITDEYLICLEDGKRFKSLKRHLRTSFGMTPDDYRAKWGLAHDYPMVAPGYSETRSKLAKEMGLGQKR